MVQVTLEETLRRLKPKLSVWEVKGHIRRGAVKGAGKGGPPAQGVRPQPRGDGVGCARRRGLRNSLGEGLRH